MNWARTRYPVALGWPAVLTSRRRHGAGPGYVVAVRAAANQYAKLSLAVLPSG